MSAAVGSFIVFIYFISSEASHYHIPKDCLVYNFEKMEDTLEYKTMRLDFLFDNYIGRIQEWQTQPFFEDFGKPHFNIGSVGIKAAEPRPPYILSYGVSRTKINVVNGGVFEFNIYKNSSIVTFGDDVAYITVILLDPLSKSNDNLTLIINEQKEGWSQPVLRLPPNTSKNKVSYIHFFGHFSKSTFFYVDSLRYYAEPSKKVQCPFYNSTKNLSLYIEEITTIATKTFEAIQRNAGTILPTESSRKKKENAEINLEEKTTTVVILKTTTNFNVETRTASIYDKKHLFSSSLEVSNAYNFLGNLTNKLHTKLQNISNSVKYNQTVMPRLQVLSRSYLNIEEEVNNKSKKPILQKSYGVPLNLKKIADKVKTNTYGNNPNIINSNENTNANQNDGSGVHDSKSVNDLDNNTNINSNFNNNTKNGTDFNNKTRKYKVFVLPDYDNPIGGKNTGTLLLVIIVIGVFVVVTTITVISVFIFRDWYR